MATTDKAQAQLRLRVLSPLGSVVDAEVDSVMLPGLLGDFTVLSDHHETVAQLRAGIGKYTAGDEHGVLSLIGGVATVRNDEVEVLAPVCERADELDEARARDAQRRAEERLADQTEGTDIARARAALHRALLRLEATQLLRQK